tara:strand:+ start:993 stop:1142 length:150 start_codon:yes stop_codon:yes gene_type:complete
MLEERDAGAGHAANASRPPGTMPIGTTRSQKSGKPIVGSFDAQKRMPHI